MPTDNNVVEFSHVDFSYDRRPIFQGVEMVFPRGKVVAIMGGSGTGKTTALRLIGGQLMPDRGEVRVNAKPIHLMSHAQLYAMRRKMGMLFQFGALFTDLTAFENVAFPLREHTDLPESMIRDLVLMKLNAVGLRGAQGLKPAELSGGMARRVALARAIALDPMLIMYDEPFTGLDPISVGIIGNLIRRLNDALGATSIVVTHDVQASLKIVDYVYFLSGGGVVAEGSPHQVLNPRNRSFTNSYMERRTDQCHSTIARQPIARIWELAADMIGSLFAGLRLVGRRSINAVWRTGSAARFVGIVLLRSGLSFRRFRLTIDELYFAGVLSLIIIIVSGLFVGLVLGLQGYETLKRYGSAEAVGTLVALALVRELGPVVAALLFASRAGSAMTAEIGIMKSTEQLSAMEMMAVDPFARVISPMFWGGFFSMPLLAAIFSVMGIFGGYLITVVVIGVDSGAFWSQMQSNVDLREDILNGVIKSIVFGAAVTAIALFEGYDAPPTAEGVSHAVTRTVVTSALAVLALDFVLTAFMFTGV